MTQRDRTYWIRQTQEQMARNNKRADAYTREIFDSYARAAANVEKEINAMWGKYAKDNNLTMSEANRLLTGDEHRVWRKSLDAYVEDLSKTGKQSSTLRELNTLSAKSRISRKERLLGNIYGQLLDLAGDYEHTVTDMLSGMLKANYYEAAYSLQHGLGVAWDIGRIPEHRVRQIIEYPWADRSYSESIWKNIDKLHTVLRQELSTGLIDGSGVDKMARRVADRMGQSKKTAKRLVRAESKRVSSEGYIGMYRDQGVKRYKWISSDGCGACADMAGSYDIGDEATEKMEDIPPMHPNCLCIIQAEFDLNLFADKRDVTPLKEHVKYQEWAKQYIK